MSSISSYRTQDTPKTWSSTWSRSWLGALRKCLYTLRRHDALMHSFTPSGEAWLRIQPLQSPGCPPHFPLILPAQPLPTWGADFVSPQAEYPCLLFFLCRLPACPFETSSSRVLSARLRPGLPHPATPPPPSWPLQGRPLLTPSHACLIQFTPTGFFFLSFSHPQLAF